MAIVKVTPMILDKAVAVPKQPIPVIKSPDDMNKPIAATLPRSIPKFMAWRPGNSNGAEFSKPIKGKISFRVNLEIYNTPLLKTSSTPNKILCSSN